MLKDSTNHGGTSRWETLYRDFLVLKKVGYGQPYPVTPNTTCEPRGYCKPSIPIIILFWTLFICQTLEKCSTYISSYTCKLAIFLIVQRYTSSLSPSSSHHKALLLVPLMKTTLATPILHPFLLLYWRVTAYTDMNLCKKYLHHFAIRKCTKSTHTP